MLEPYHSKKVVECFHRETHAHSSASMCLFLITLRSFYGTERENGPRFGVITVFCNYGHYESVFTESSRLYSNGAEESGPGYICTEKKGKCN